MYFLIENLVGHLTYVCGGGDAEGVWGKTGEKGTGHATHRHGAVGFIKTSVAFRFLHLHPFTGGTLRSGGNTSA